MIASASFKGVMRRGLSHPDRDATDRRHESACGRDMGIAHGVSAKPCDQDAASALSELELAAPEAETPGDALRKAIIGLTMHYRKAVGEGHSRGRVAWCRETDRPRDLTQRHLEDARLTPPAALAFGRPSREARGRSMAPEDTLECRGRNRRRPVPVSADPCRWTSPRAAIRGRAKIGS